MRRNRTGDSKLRLYDRVLADCVACCVDCTGNANLRMDGGDPAGGISYRSFPVVEDAMIYWCSVLVMGVLLSLLWQTLWWIAKRIFKGRCDHQHVTVTEDGGRCDDCGIDLRQSLKRVIQQLHEIGKRN